MSNNTATETTATKTSKAAKAEETLAMEALNKSVESSAVILDLQGQVLALTSVVSAQVESINGFTTEVAAYTARAETAAADAAAASAVMSSALHVDVVNEAASIRALLREERRKPQRDIAGDVGFVLGAVGGGCAVRYLMKNGDVMTQITGAALGGVGGAAAARVGGSAYSAAATFLRNRKEERAATKAAEAAKPKPEGK